MAPIFQQKKKKSTNHKNEWQCKNTFPYIYFCQYFLKILSKIINKRGIAKKKKKTVMLLNNLRLVCCWFLFYDKQINYLN